MWRALVDGDILESIEGQDTRNISLAMIQQMLEGAPNSTLTVGVVRPSKVEPDRIAMRRTLAAVPPVVDSVYENSSILYLKPEILDHDHVQQVEAKLKGMQKAGNKKILLDLRDVAAGDMVEATTPDQYAAEERDPSRPSKARNSRSRFSQRTRRRLSSLRLRSLSW